MSDLVHLQTTIQTVFGLVLPNGEVIQQQPVVVSVGPLDNLLNPEMGKEAHDTIAHARDQALANYEAEQAAVKPKPTQSGNRAQRRATAKRSKT